MTSFRYILLFLLNLSGFFFHTAQTSAQEESPEARHDNALTVQVDNMYLKGLNYLKDQQLKEGFWRGQYGDEPGVVGFALMAFLAHGDDPNSGPYSAAIQKCITYIFNKQNPTTGYIGSTMYTHGFATLALAEAYGVVDNEQIGPKLRQAINLILLAQNHNPKGGWRYSPEANDADTSIVGCQMMALFAARNAGLEIPEEAFQRAQKFMNSCRQEQGGYGYTSPSGVRVTLSAIGSLVQSLGGLKNTASYKTTLEYLKRNLHYREDSYVFYFEYYMAQALFHADMATWKEWNNKNIRLLFSSQQSDGSWSAGTGQAYGTTLALLSLAVNYRFLPIYEK